MTESDSFAWFRSQQQQQQQQQLAVIPPLHMEIQMPNIERQNSGNHKRAENMLKKAQWLLLRVYDCIKHGQTLLKLKNFTIDM